MIVNNRSFIPKDYKGIPENAELMFEGVIFDVYQWGQPDFSGGTLRFEMLKRADSVAVLAITDDDKILINYEQQPHAGKFIDMPSGRHDHPEEDELAAAKRELLEETGYTFENWKLVKCVSNGTKLDHLLYIFVAWREVSKVDLSLDSGEKIETKRLSLEQLKELITSNNPPARLRLIAEEKDFLMNLSSFDDLKKMLDLRST